MTRWANAASPLVSFAMSNQWFNDIGLYSLGYVKTGDVFIQYAEWKYA